MLDILIMTETKLDYRFPVSQFQIDGYSKPYRLDRNRNGGGIIIYVREDILGRMFTKHNFPDNVEGLFVELNFRKSKWLLGGMYHPPSQPGQYFFNTLDNALDAYSNYKNYILTSILMLVLENQILILFYISMRQEISTKNQHVIKLVKNSEKNFQKNFFKTNTVFTGLLDFHKLVLFVFKSIFPKSKPNETTYRNFKNFIEENFNKELKTNLGEKCVKNYASFENVFLDSLNKHAPLKKKVIRRNHAPYVTKSLRNAMMKRSNLQMIYF